MNHYQVRSFTVAQSRVPGPQLFWMSNWEDWFPLHFQVVLIRSAEVTALVNTGPPADLTGFPRLRRTPPEGIEAVLAAAGVDPDQVTHVLLTPLQLYSTGNVPLFRNAEICLSRRGWVHFHTSHSHPHDVRWKSIPKEVLVHLVTDGWDRVRLLADEDQLAPGLRTWWCGVHHRSSLVVEVDTADGPVCISDAYFYYENVEQDRILGINENMYEALAAYQRVRATAAHIVPLYDPKVFQRYPGGIIASGET